MQHTIESVLALTLGEAEHSRTPMFWTHRLALMLLATLLSGCGGIPKPPTANSSLGGNWQFNINSTELGVYNLSGTLQESSNNPAEETITGSLTMDQSLGNCSGTYSVLGGISGTTIIFLGAVQFINFTGTANSDFTSMSGSYTGGCDTNDHGTWSATKS
jgi:hypothetical protein